MTLDEAIKHCHEKAEEIRKANEEMPTYCKLSEELCECAKEHEQLAEWLEELKEWRKLKEEQRPQGKWTPVSEGLPDDLEPVNITWINHEPEPYYKEIKDKPFTATGVYFNGQWYWWSILCTDTLAEYSFSYDDMMDTAIEVIAWQPLPESYRKGGTE